jgi:hypothetical protein
VLIRNLSFGVSSNQAAVQLSVATASNVPIADTGVRGKLTLAFTVWATKPPQSIGGIANTLRRNIKFL